MPGDAKGSTIFLLPFQQARPLAAGFTIKYNFTGILMAIS